jgi:hypothetical protein
MSRQTTISLIVAAVVGISSIALVWNDASAYYYRGGYHHYGYGNYGYRHHHRGNAGFSGAACPNPPCY